MFTTLAKICNSGTPRHLFLALVEKNPQLCLDDKIDFNVVLNSLASLEAIQCLPGFSAMGRSAYRWSVLTYLRNAEALGISPTGVQYLQLMLSRILTTSLPAFCQTRAEVFSASASSELHELSAALPVSDRNILYPLDSHYAHRTAWLTAGSTQNLEGESNEAIRARWLDAMAPEMEVAHATETKFPFKAVGFLLLLFTAALALTVSGCTSKTQQEDEFQLQDCRITGCYPIKGE
jgi:hypothetical protein